MSGAGVLCLPLSQSVRTWIEREVGREGGSCLPVRLVSLAKDSCVASATSLPDMATGAGHRVRGSPASKRAHGAASAAKIVLFRGPPASGKSILSTLVARQLRLTLVHKDNVYDVLAEHVDTHLETATGLRRCHKCPGHRNHGTRGVGDGLSHGVQRARLAWRRQH